MRTVGAGTTWRLLPFFLLGGVSMSQAASGTFEDLGIPVRKAGLMGAIAGPDATGKKRLLYFNFNQSGAPLFLVVVDPDTGETHQYNAPQGPGAWGFIVGPDDRIYLGTWDGGLILRFDPKQPEKGIEVVGKPSATESYIWMYALGPDGKLYGCTYGQAKLISYDPRTGEMADLGRMDETQQYSRSVATGPDGKIYIGIGYARANVVVYDPATGKHESILPDEARLAGTGAAVHLGSDGQVYAQVGDHWFRAEQGKLQPIPASEFPGNDLSPRTLADGRILTHADLDGNYTLTDPKTGQTTSGKFQYQGAGSGLFVVGVGPHQRIYGSTAMPLELFEYDPASGRLQDLGNPTPVGGEIYSLVDWHGKLYVCAYPGSWLSVYDPDKPWSGYGTGPQDNPRGIGNIGDGHLRPRAMIVGPEENLYIGSLPPYGQLGGALGVFDPRQDKTIENYRHLIPDQSIVALAYDAESGLVFGGSSIAGGGGSTPSQSDAHFFVWDPQGKRILHDWVPAPGHGSIVALAAASGKVFGVTSGRLLFVWDIASQRAIYTAMVPFGPVHEISLGRWKDGLIYGLAGNTIFTIHPQTYEMREVATYPGGISCGFGLAESGIYFGSGVHLIRYRWPE